MPRPRMRATHRRAIGLAVTLLAMTVYVFFAASIGGLFADRHWTLQIGYFAVAGLAWTVPLYPVFRWMRAPDADAPPVEKPPAAAGRKPR